MDAPSVLPGFVGVVLFLILSVLPVDAGYSCATYSPYYFREYCYGGQTRCCGYYYGYRYCCGYSLSGGAIAGVAIGCVIGIVVLIGLIVVCCNIMNKNRGMAGRVIYPNDGTNNVTVVNSTHQHHAGFTGGPIPPPGYAQSTYPAYPPGAGPAYPPAGPSQYPPPPPPSYTQPDTNSYPQKY